MALPLEGIRVIDVGTRISAPFCAGILGEQGAEVIKVEDPRGGDFMRTIGPFVDGYSLFWAVEGRGRKSVTCNLRVAEGQELFRRLCATADVVCENFRPGTMEKWNIGPADLDPRLIYVRISVFGQDGPYSKRPGLDRMGIGYGGLLHLTGYPDRPPVRPGVTTSDYLTGVLRRRLPSRCCTAVIAPAAPAAGVSSMRRCTARSCASWSGRSRATTGSASCAGARATASPTRLRSTTTPPPTASTCASSPAPTPTSHACARPCVVTT